VLDAVDNGDSKVTLLLDHAGSEAYPHPFQLRVSVEVRAQDGALVQRLRVTNPTGADSPLTFTAALHTYFRVGDIAGFEAVLEAAGAKKDPIEDMGGALSLEFLDPDGNRLMAVQIL
jgi:D-hexose-6-phosphate mutarotase